MQKPSAKPGASRRPLPAEIRAAREFLRKRGIKGITARKFHLASIETGLDYRRLLAFLQDVAKQTGKSPVRTVHEAA